VLSGRLDDGTAGLHAVKEMGGTAVVQDPDDALHPDMPRNALAGTTVDHVVPAGELGALLVGSLRSPSTSSRQLGVAHARIARSDASDARPRRATGVDAQECGRRGPGSEDPRPVGARYRPITHARAAGAAARGPVPDIRRTGRGDHGCRARHLAARRHTRTRGSRLDLADHGALAQADLVAAVSHEMRTPLQAILGYAQLLAEGVTGSFAETREFARRIVISSLSLAQVVDNLIQLSAARLGRIQLDIRSFDAQRLIADVVRFADPLARHKRIMLRADLVPLEMTSDARRLRQIVVNLVENAVRRTESGEVVVRLAADKASDGTTVRITVCDPGHGIDAADLPHVFEPSRHGTQPVQASMHDPALGLSTVRQLTRLLGGDARAVEATRRGMRVHRGASARGAGDRVGRRLSGPLRLSRPSSSPRLARRGAFRSIGAVGAIRLLGAICIRGGRLLVHHHDDAARLVAAARDQREDRRLAHDVAAAPVDRGQHHFVGGQRAGETGADGLRGLLEREADVEAEEVHVLHLGAPHAPQTPRPGDSTPAREGRDRARRCRSAGW
jgi:signal transduction histidine kinase